MQQNADNKSINRIGLVFYFLGGLFTLISCGVLAAGIALDLFGAEATGEMTNISYDAKRSDNPFTAQVSFTTAEGEERSFISWEDRFFFELDEQLRGNEDGLPVRYFESFPLFAKVTFVYHAEYVNQIIWLFWSSVALMIGVITRRNKPITIDLSQRKK